MERHRIVVISGGKFAREVLGWIQHCIRAGAPWEVKGILDNRHEALSKHSYSWPVLADVESYSPERNDRFVCAIGEPQMKRHYVEKLLARGAEFANLIHPSTALGEHVTLGQGVIMAPFSALTSDIVLGSFVTISSFSGAGHDTRIGDYCQISSHCGINGNAVLDEGVFLGSHSVILPHAQVGPWAHVGAGSVVLKRVAPWTKVFGNPAVEIGRVASIMAR